MVIVAQNLVAVALAVVDSRSDWSCSILSCHTVASSVLSLVQIPARVLVVLLVVMLMVVVIVVGGSNR